MSKSFDATLKELLDRAAADWVGWLAPAAGLPADTAADPLDADLSTVSPQADKVFRLSGPATGLLHLELQSDWDGTLADRLHLYNTLLHHRYGEPVASIGVLLRREADATHLTGDLERLDPAGRVCLRFRYFVVRVWELPLAPLLAGPPGVLPLAPLTDEAATDVPGVLRAIDDRLRGAAGPVDFIWSACYFLLGLRYDTDDAVRWFQEIHGMEESSTYRYVIQKGARQGALEARRVDVLSLLEKRFGPVPAAVAEQVRAEADEDRLRAALLRVLDVRAIDEFVV